MRTQATTDELRRRTVEAVVNHSVLLNNNAYSLHVDCVVQGAAPQAFFVQVNVADMAEMRQVSNVLPLNVVLNVEGRQPEFLYLTADKVVACDEVELVGESLCNFDFR